MIDKGLGKIALNATYEVVFVSLTAFAIMISRHQFLDPPDANPWETYDIIPNA
jgi:hypothetical protein